MEPENQQFDPRTGQWIEAVPLQVSWHWMPMWLWRLLHGRRLARKAAAVSPLDPETPAP